MRMFSYGDVLRLALNGTHTSICADESALSRHIAPTSTHSAKRTADRIDGQFEMIRTKSGETIFVGEDGQYIRR